MGGQQHIGPIRLLDLHAEPGQGNEDVKRRRLVRLKIESAERGIVGDGSDLQPRGDRAVLVGGQRHIAGHQSRFLDSQHDLIPGSNAQPASDSFAQNDSARHIVARSTGILPVIPNPWAGCPCYEVVRRRTTCFAGTCRIELVRHTENLNPVDALRTIIVRNNAGHLQDRSYGPAKLLLQIICKRRPEVSALRQDGKLNLPQTSLQGLLEGVPHRIANRQRPGQYARRDDDRQQNGQSSSASRIRCCV